MEDNHSKNSVPGDSTDLTTVKGEKTGIPKWLMVTVIAMAAVIVGLTVTLIAVIAGKSANDDADESGNNDGDGADGQRHPAAGDKAGENVSAQAVSTHQVSV